MVSALVWTWYAPVLSRSESVLALFVLTIPAFQPVA